MIITDVNPLIYAFRSDSPFHDLARGVLRQAQEAGALLLLPEVASSFLRIVTDPRLMTQPDEPHAAWGFLDALAAGGRFVTEPRSTRWVLFRDVALRNNVQGKLVPDALLAATCLDFGASILTADRDFLSFSGLHVNLLTSIGIIDHTVA